MILKKKPILQGILVVGCVSVLFFLAGCENLTQQKPNFNGIWQVTEYDEIRRPDETAKLTEEARRRIAFYKENFDPVAESGAKFCDTDGMPLMMLTRARTYPREIYQSDDRIFYMLEYMDLYRQIHLDKDQVPEGFYSTEMGYSIGHWEGDELVVVTTNLNGTPEVGGFQRSDQAVITERWRLIDHPDYGESIEIKMTVEDPILYTEPAFGRSLFMRSPPDVQVNSYDCPRTLWDDYVNKKLESLKE